MGWQLPPPSSLPPSDPQPKAAVLGAGGRLGILSALSLAMGMSPSVSPACAYLQQVAELCQGILQVRGMGAASEELGAQQGPVVLQPLPDPAQAVLGEKAGSGWEHPPQQCRGLMGTSCWCPTVTMPPAQGLLVPHST